MEQYVTGTKRLIPLAHSPRQPGEDGDPYARHIQAVRTGVRQRAEAMLHFAVEPPDVMLETLGAAATFHDLG